jgi:hypothetical protein
VEIHHRAGKRSANDCSLEYVLARRQLAFELSQDPAHLGELRTDLFLALFGYRKQLQVGFAHGLCILGDLRPVSGLRGCDIGTMTLESQYSRLALQTLFEKNLHGRYFFVNQGDLLGFSGDHLPQASVLLLELANARLEDLDATLMRCTPADE